MKTLLLAAAAALAIAAPAQAIQLKYSFDGTLTYTDAANNAGSTAFSVSGVGNTANSAVVGLFGAAITVVPLSDVALFGGLGIPAGGTLSLGATGNMVGLLYTPGNYAIGFTGVSGYDGLSALAPTAISLAFTNPQPFAFGGFTLTGGSGTFSAAAVPEPATWALLTLGFGLVGHAARRRRAAFAAA